MKSEEKKKRNKRVTYQVDTATIEENINKLPGGKEGNKDRYEFSMRLNELLAEKQIDQVVFAKKLNISNGSIFNYRNGKREPSLTTLVKMANELDVSVDYLAGKSNCPNYKLEKINEKIGLSQKAIENLYKLQHDYCLFQDVEIDIEEKREISKQYKKHISILNLILEDDVNLFWMIDSIKKYIEKSNKLYNEIKELKKKGDIYLVPKILDAKNELITLGARIDYCFRKLTDKILEKDKEKDLDLFLYERKK